MEQASFNLIKTQNDGDGEGEVTVAITEGLGSIWLTSSCRTFTAPIPM